MKEYIVINDSIKVGEYEDYSAKDKNLLTSLSLNTSFNPKEDEMQLHVYSLDGTRLASEQDYRGYFSEGDSIVGDAYQKIYVDPVKDSIKLGYSNGDIDMLYHFTHNSFSNTLKQGFYINTLSTDRSELQVFPVSLNDAEIVDQVTALKDRFANDPYFNEIRLDFGNNDLFIAVNIDYQIVGNKTYVVFKLYEPLPTAYGIKDTFKSLELVSDSIQYEVRAKDTAAPEVFKALKGPNFNVDIIDQEANPTKYFDINDLFSYPVSNSYSELYTLTNQKGIRLSVDYSDFNNFVHFSSIEERVKNFFYKVGLIENYQSSYDILSGSAVSGSVRSGSLQKYDNLISNITKNFDAYESFLYYNSSSHAFPKVNSVKPYINAEVGSTAANAWYSDKIASSSLYDDNNASALRYTLPSFIYDNPDNNQSVLFLDMLGQHYDNLWIYQSAITEKYDADNRLDRGISRDLVEDALKSLGVKLYNSSFNNSDLYSYFIDNAFNTGSEVIDVEVSASNDQQVPFSDYEQEVQKRLYHNLSFLLKGKGTQRGVRALVSSFGIPTNLLVAKEQGGVFRDTKHYLGEDYLTTGSRDKIRTDNTSSFLFGGEGYRNSGSYLSELASSQQDPSKYTRDNEYIEFGFSPSNDVNQFISQSIVATYASWSLDQFIGDARNRHSSYYPDLKSQRDQIMLSVTPTDLSDYVRILRFWDNAVFKMIRDYVPARSPIATGGIIKSHMLERNKVAFAAPEWSRTEFSQSIDVVNTTGSCGGATDLTDATTAYSYHVVNKTGSLQKSVLEGEACFTGEYSGSYINATDGELNTNPKLKHANTVPARYNIFGALAIPAVPPINPTPGWMTWDADFVLPDAGDAKPTSRKFVLSSILINQSDLSALNIESAIDNLESGDRVSFPIRFSTTDGALPPATTVHNVTVNGIVKSTVPVTNTVYRIVFEDFTIWQGLVGDIIGGYVGDTLLDEKIDISPFLFNPVDFKNSDLNPLINNASENIENIYKTPNTSRLVDDSNIFGLSQSYDNSASSIFEFDFANTSFPMIVNAAQARSNNLMLVGQNRDEVELVGASQKGFVDTGNLAYPFGSDIKIKEFSPTATDIDGVQSLGFNAPPYTPEYYIPWSGSISGSFGPTPPGASTLFGAVFGNSPTDKVNIGKRLSDFGLKTGSAQETLQQVTSAISLSISNGEKWYMSTYVNLPAEVHPEDPIRLLGPGGAIGQLGYFVDRFDDYLQSVSVFPIAGAGDDGTNAYINLKNPDTGFGWGINGEQIGNGVDGVGLLIWKLNEDSLLFNETSLVSIGPGGITPSDPSNLVETEFTYITTTYGNNPNK